MSSGLVLRGLSVCYGKARALDPLTLEVAPGSIMTIVGPNGAGKTSLLGAVSGALRAEGDVVVDGFSMAMLDMEDRVERGLVLVPERRELFGSMTVEDNLRLGAFVRRQLGSPDREIDYVYGLFPRLMERRLQLAATLSGGERQMLALGRALMSKPRYLLLDEPSLGLAPLLVTEVLRSIRQLARDGLTVMLVEQNARAALEVADEACVLESGQIVLRGSAGELSADARLLDAYLGSGPSWDEPTGEAHHG